MEKTAGSEVTASTTVEHDAILRAIQVLEAATASPSLGREAAWGQRVTTDLAPVVEEVIAHCQSAEGPHGLVRELELVLGRPRLLRVTSAEHDRLAGEASEFLEWLSSDPDVDSVRTRAARFTADLRTHQAHEADLIYEAFFRDIGVGD
jgi:hypothetical protein